MDQETIATEAAPHPELLPGAQVIARIRRLLIVTLVSGLGYSMVMLASKGYCAGGVTAGGGFVDATGEEISSAPMCIDMRLGPSVFVFVALGILVLATLGRVVRRAVTEDEALRMLDRAALAVVIVVVASAVIAHVWFAFIPITGFNSGGSNVFWYPFPFGSVSTEITPMAPEP